MQLRSTLLICFVWLLLLPATSTRAQEVSTDPPPAPVRLMAEWEESQALLVSWRNQHAILLREIVRHGSAECKVIIFADNPSAVSNYLSSGNVSLENVEILSPEYDSIWIRDYGPWTIYHNDVDSLMIADYIYNRPWRPNDDKIPAFIAQYLGLPIYEAIEPPYDWVHSGGNNLRDGMGTIFSSDLILEENPFKTEAEIDQIANLFFGADRYVKLPALPYDVIHHLDMHMRFIDEETIIIGEYPDGVSDGPQIEANIEYLLNEVPTPFGNPYRIIRIPMPPDAQGRYPDQNGDYRTYTNSLFVNGTVLVPTYDEQYDTTALRIYEEALPGYNIVGIDCNGIIPSLGAIHCITKLVGVNDPLWIAHARLRDQESTEDAYPLSAIIKHKSGIAEATLHYRTADEADYTTVNMVLSDTSESVWTSSIPPFPENTVVEYYLAAEANSGKSQVRPIVAPEGYFRFKVDALQPAFGPESREICPGEAVAFENLTTGAYDSIRWYFPGGQPATSTVEMPTVTYQEGGSYAVELIAYKGSIADTLAQMNHVEVRQLQQPYLETFEDAFPAATWTVENPEGDLAAWERVDFDFCDPGAMRINNFLVDTRNTSDYLRANFDLSSLNDPTLRFDVAHAQKTTGIADGLRVNLIDCDGNKTTVYEAFGSDLATASPEISPFVPEGCDEWRTETVSLADFTGQAVTIEFENVGDYGNFIYLDLIEVLDLDPTSASFAEAGVLKARIFPNPVVNQAQLSVRSPKAGVLAWSLTNQFGQQMRSGQTEISAGGHQLQLPVEGLSAGTYNLQLSQGQSRTTLRMTIVE